jgi:hypothetical protein
VRQINRWDTFGVGNRRADPRQNPRLAEPSDCPRPYGPNERTVSGRIESGKAETPVQHSAKLLSPSGPQPLPPVARQLPEASLDARKVGHQ